MRWVIIWSVLVTGQISSMVSDARLRAEVRSLTSRVQVLEARLDEFEGRAETLFLLPRERPTAPEPPVIIYSKRGER